MAYVNPGSREKLEWTDMFWERYFSLVLAAFNAAFYVEIDAG
jgi:hypothetical protein